MSRTAQIARMLEAANEEARRNAWRPIPELPRVRRPVKVNLPPLSPELQAEADAQWEEL